MNGLKEFTWDRTGGSPITENKRNPLLYKKFWCRCNSGKQVIWLKNIL